MFPTFALYYSVMSPTSGQVYIDDTFLIINCLIKVLCFIVQSPAMTSIASRQQIVKHFYKAQMKLFIWMLLENQSAIALLIKRIISLRERALNIILRRIVSFIFYRSRCPNCSRLLKSTIDNFDNPFKAFYFVFLYCSIILNIKYLNVTCKA